MPATHFALGGPPPAELISMPIPHGEGLLSPPRLVPIGLVYFCKLRSCGCTCLQPRSPQPARRSATVPLPWILLASALVACSAPSPCPMGFPPPSSFSSCREKRKLQFLPSDHPPLGGSTASFLFAFLRPFFSPLQRMTQKTKATDRHHSVVRFFPRPFNNTFPCGNQISRPGAHRDSPRSL